MKSFKKILAVLCSATMIVSASLPAFAAEETTAATGNVIAYTFDTVTVPTTIKVAFNPQGLPITIGEDADGEALTTTDKIVSLGYGIANKSSIDKKIVVKFAANAVAVDGETADVEFVDSEAKTQAKSDSNADGAVAGEHKIMLYVTPATAQPTINDGENDGAGTAFAVADGDDGKTENASGTNLADVKMTAAALEKGIIFGEGENNDAFANLGFALDKSTYSLKTGESIDFDTPQSEVADKLELSAFGAKSITGFTFKGFMNDNTVWTRANISAISITPIYEITDKGEEVAVEDTQGMVTLTEADDIAEPDAPAEPTPAAPVSGTGMTASSTEGVDYEATFTKGTAYEITAVGVTAATWASTVDGTYAESANIVKGTDKVTIAASNWAGASAGNARFVKVTIGSDNYIIKFTIAE